MKILFAVGARPNFMKLAPLLNILEDSGQDYKVVHTGQHYDENMSEVFFRELDIKKPDYNFGVGRGMPAQQIARTIELFGEVCEKEKPNVVVVVGDVNSTLACAIATSKLNGVKLAHVEAGERSFDRSMPEEMNRVVTDVLSDYLFCATPTAATNLLDEGHAENRIHVVGNVAIDSLLKKVADIPADDSCDKYILCTIHRQSNTDDKRKLENILGALKNISKKIDIIFPIHPRTSKAIRHFGLDKYLKTLDVRDPLKYVEFVHIMRNASAVLTDSGGVQVETTVLNIPCVTLRDNTEWIFTLSEGTNILVGTNKDRIIHETLNILNGEIKHKKLSIINANLLDGRASRRIVDILLKNII